jgi:hypothetical protein
VLLSSLGTQDHIGLDVIADSGFDISPIFSWRCSRFHERSENQRSAGGEKQSKQKCPQALVDKSGDASRGDLNQERRL